MEKGSWRLQNGLPGHCDIVSLEPRPLEETSEAVRPVVASD